MSENRPVVDPPSTAQAALAEDGRTTLDRFLDGRITIRQPVHGHRAGLDAVFLAAAALGNAPAAKARLLDAGAGVGIAGLCLLARVPGLSVTAVEIEPELCALARANGAMNGFADRYQVVAADITAPGKERAAAGLQPESFDHVIANPPFYGPGEANAALSEERSRAHVMPADRLQAWARFLAAMAAPQARLTMIHRPQALSAILQALDRRFGSLTLFPLFPRQGEDASRILIQGVKGSRAPSRMRPGLVLHRADGRYTDEAEAILRGRAGLAVSP